MHNQKDHQFLKNRQRLILLWRPTAIVMLTILLILIVWLFVKAPYLINPVFVVEAIQDNTIDQSVLSLSALMLPIVVIFLFLTVTIFILFGFAIISNERRYLSIIRALEEKKS